MKAAAVLVNVGRIDDAPADLPLAEDGGLLMPLRASASQQDGKKKAPLTVLHTRDGVNVLKHVNLKTFHYDLTFCITFHKLQGMTLPRLLLDLSIPTYPPHHGFDTVLVAASRIGEGKNLRVLPGSDIGHLARLEADPRIQAWMQGFPEDGGVWNRELAIAALPQKLAGNSNRSAGRGRGRGRGVSFVDGSISGVAGAAMSVAGGRGDAAGRGSRGVARGGGGVRVGRGRGGGAAARLTDEQLRNAQNAQPATPPQNRSSRSPRTRWAIPRPARPSSSRSPNRRPAISSSRLEIGRAHV